MELNSVEVIYLYQECLWGLHRNPEPQEIPSAGPGSWGEGCVLMTGRVKEEEIRQTQTAHLQMQEFIIPMVATFSPKYHEMWQKCFNLKTWVHQIFVFHCFYTSVGREGGNRPSATTRPDGNLDNVVMTKEKHLQAFSLRVILLSPAFVTVKSQHLWKVTHGI